MILAVFTKQHLF